MASRELSLKGNDNIIQTVLKRTPTSSPIKEGDSNASDATYRSTNVASEPEISFPSSLLGQLKPRLSVQEKASPPATSAPNGPAILDQLFTKNKLQMKEAELRKDKNEVVPSIQDPKAVDPKILKKRKMLANRLRNPFVTKRRKRFKRKMAQQEAAKQDTSNPRRCASNSNAKKKVNVIETKADQRIACNRARRRLNSDSSATPQTKKVLINKSRPMKSQSKLSNVEALKQSSKLGRNNRYSTRSDSPVLRNGKRRKFDEMPFDLYDIDKKRKKLTNDLASVKSDGMSDEQCSYVTASESDLCSFMDLETSSQNMDVKEESCDSTFKLEIPTSPSAEGDDVNSNLINLGEPFKGIGASPGKALKKERCSIEEERKSLDLDDIKDDIKPEPLDISKDCVIDTLLPVLNDYLQASADNDCASSEKKEENECPVLTKEGENGDEDSDCEESEVKSGNRSPELNDGPETVVIGDSCISVVSDATLANSSNKIDSVNPKIQQSRSLEGCQGRKFRSASLNDSNKVETVTVQKWSQQKVDEDEPRSSDSEEHEVSFTADNTQFELFVERQYERGRKKRSSSDTSLRRLQDTSDGTGTKSKNISPILEDEKSSDANGPFSDEKENEFYEKYITEESTSEEASCSSSQVSDFPKLTDKEFSALQEMECKNDKDLKEHDEQQGSSNSKQEEPMDGGLSSSDNSKASGENTEAQAMKESILNALGLQSASMQVTPKAKPKDKYTGTLKAVIKLNRTADKKSMAGRMVFKQKDTSNTGGKNLEYRICSELAPGTENVPLTHLKDIAVNSISKKAIARPKSHFDLSGPLNEVDLEVAQVKKADDPTDGSVPKEGEPKKALVIPEKSSSFSIHPERLCSDVCSYCHGKFGSLDTPCHIGQIKNSERRSKILSIEILLTKDSCLCDACFRYVDRRANCPSFKAQAPRPQKRQPLSDAVCSVQGCGQPANHSVRRKWIVKLKKSIAKKLMIDMDKIQHNQHLPFPLCSQHYYWVDYFTVCGICKKRLSRNNMYALGPEAEELNQYLHEDGIPVHLTDKLFLCKLCRYYSSLRLKYKDLSLMTPGHKTYFRSYRRKILQYHDIEVSGSEEDVGGKSAEDDSTDTQGKGEQGKVKRRKTKKSVSDNSSKKPASDEKVRQNLSCSQGYNYMDTTEVENVTVTPTIDYSALGDNPDVGFNNIASLLGARDQPEIGVNQARIQVKFGNLNIGKLANLNIGQDARTNPERPQRPPYLPGEEELPLKADISFNSRPGSSWERGVSTIQFDKDTKQLWQELQRPYGNTSSFMRHLVMLEKHWRSGSLVLVDNADPRAVKYVNSVRNRVDSFECNFKTPTLSTILSKPPVKSPSPAPRADTPTPTATPTPSPVSRTKPETAAPSNSSDSSDKCDKLVSKSDTPQVPPASSPVLSERLSSVATSTPGSVSTSIPASRTSTPSLTTSAPSSTATATTSALVQSLNTPSAIPVVNLVNLNSSVSKSNAGFSSPSISFSSPIISVSNPSYSNPSVSYSSPSVSYSSPSVSYSSPSVSYSNPSVSYSNPSVSFSNPNISFSNSSVSLSRSSTSPNVSYASLASMPLNTSPSVSLILPPNLSTSLPSSLQNTLINFDRNNVSLNQFSAPNISISPSSSLKTPPSLSIAPKPNLPRQPRPAGAISKLLTGNKSLVSSPSSINNNPQFRKGHALDPSQLGKVRKLNPAQRQVSKLPPQLLRYPGKPRPNMPGLEIIVPNSFTMQTKTIPPSGSGQGGSRPRTPAPTQGLIENLALLRQYRSLKPKPVEPKPQSFNPMICDVRSLATEPDSLKRATASSAMPKIPKALTITQVPQKGVFPRSVTVSLEKKPNQIPAAFLGGEKPSVSVFCEVNPPP